jgi:hypothetical protein
MKKSAVLILAISILTIIVISGCGLFSALTAVTIEDRIAMFEDELNMADRSDLYTHFHPDMSMKQQWASTVVVEASVLSYAYEPFVITINSKSETGGSQTQVNASLSKSVGTVTITFMMEEDETDVWFIREIESAGLDIY